MFLSLICKPEKHATRKVRIKIAGGREWKPVLRLRVDPQP